MEVRSLTTGPVQENCYIVRAEGCARVVVIDPGEEAERILAEVEEMGATVEAVLITHCHFDHVGAVAPVAKATGAPVYCPRGEEFILEDINSYTLFRGIGPFESYTPDHLVDGGDKLALAGLEFEVVPTPGHSPAHVTYAVGGEALFSGDVLFQGSVGRVDLPGSDSRKLMASLQLLLERFPPAAQVFPGHMGTTTLGHEHKTNPFLRELSVS